VGWPLLAESRVGQPLAQIVVVFAEPVGLGERSAFLGAASVARATSSVNERR